MKRIKPFSRKLLIIYFYIILIIIGFNILKYSLFDDDDANVFFYGSEDEVDIYSPEHQKYHHNIYNLDNDFQDQNNILAGEDDLPLEQVPDGVPSDLVYLKFLGSFDRPTDDNIARRCRGIDDKRWYYLIKKPMYPNQTVDMEIYNDSGIQFQYPDREYNQSIPRMIIALEPPHLRHCSFNQTCYKIFNFKVSYEAQSDIRTGFDTHKTSAFKTYNFIPARDMVEIKNQFKKDYQIMKTTNLSALQPHQIPSLPLANWFCSNCQDVRSNRLEYVQELMKYIVIDSYGHCLNNMPTQEILKRLSNDPFAKKKEVITKYKFTIVFENSICKDYVSEKVLDALTAGSVPIFMGHPSTIKYLPYNSYIYVGDFNSTQELANHLIYLDQNDDEYNKILLNWRTNETAIEQWKGVNNYPYKPGFIIREFECAMLRHYQLLKSGVTPFKNLKYKPINEVCLPSNYFKIKLNKI
ncbi:hypothetical protein DDB_G0284551 [Dictyostelium discoideum AX4]|uniref:Fucosyltransferase n=1 Tax=Dictyostelium discoideum TaxID=44689 RepID=Q54PK3_DICDI|nr:hypothetical protein DDB_G0284551 [Dictyostelium discoideum AX4]EAL65202.1 hypothetical protein DDB_G0284551 [Dictyostelium discoideum AX4]|eukprot:XP_638529.1 hypothetical protein DDB_G0284551 [Dictyostelium discoideum AX4]